MKKLPTLVLLILFTALSVSAQTTRIRGKVTDASTGDPMALVSVTVPGTAIGTTTDFEGNYVLETREKITTLVALYLSYESSEMEVTPGQYNNIDFQLVPIINELETVVVKRGEDPAYGVLRNVHKHKKLNNPDEFDSYRYTTYTKMELDIVNMKPEFKNKKMQKNFGFVFEYMDTSAITGRSFLPVMISEATADYYYSKSNPSVSREVMKASRISGIEEEYTLAQFTGHMHVNVNFYNNYINIFEVNFASPLSEHGSLYYKYYLVDSTNMDGRKIYKIRFHPKGKGTPVFDGEVNIDSMTWALESATMRMVKDLNVNWIRDLFLQTKCELQNDSTWFVKQDRIVADFSIQMKDSSKLISFMGQREINYSDVEINCSIPPEIQRLTSDVIANEDILINDEQYWSTIRPYDLSEREKGIFQMVDSVKNAPLYKSFYDIINTILFGYMKAGKFEIGPYYKLYSFNKYEGDRFSLGLRTNKDFSKKIRLSAYGAYGTRDKEWKGGGSVEYMLARHPMSKLTISATHDVQQLGVGEDAFTTSNIMGSIFSRRNDNKMTMVDRVTLEWRKEWFEGFTNRFSSARIRMEANPAVDFVRPDGTKAKEVNAFELQVGTRLSKNEIVIRKNFETMSMWSDYPIVTLNLTAGVKDILNSGYEYYKTELIAQYGFNIPPLGRSDIILSGGKIFGKVPFPLLKLHEGNATYFYDPMAYSCMNFYEFASDLWGSVLWEHHFKGFFLGRIPLMNRLKWREIVTVKALWGSLQEKNDGSLTNTSATFLFPEGMSSVKKPYVEAGFGIENIFRLFRIDAMWRVTHREGPERKSKDNFAINFSFKLSF